MKLFSAAPLSGLPSEPTALGVQASFLHLLIDAVLAAPESGLGSALTALAAQLSDAGAGACATATPIANTETKAANAIRFMWLSLSRQQLRDACTNTASCRHNYGRHRMLHRPMLPFALLNRPDMLALREMKINGPDGRDFQVRSGEPVRPQSYFDTFRKQVIKFLLEAEPAHVAGCGSPPGCDHHKAAAFYPAITFAGAGPGGLSENQGDAGF